MSTPLAGHTLPEGFSAEEGEDSTVWLFTYQDLLFEGRPNARFALITPDGASRASADTALRDTLYRNERFTVLGRYADVDLIFQRYTTGQRPEMYPAGGFNGPLAAPRIASDPEATHWRTVIRDDCGTQGIDFAGHYTIAEWGCGAMCEVLAVIDRKDGHVYFSSIPFDTLDGHYGARYSAESRMIVINSGLLEMRPGYRWLFDHTWPSTYVWDERDKRFDLVETTGP